MENQELLKLLIVDDDRDVRMGMFQGVNWESLGFFPVDQAENGLEAIHKVEQQPPDAILTDIRMNIMDGLEMIRFLSVAYPRIKIVLVSGYSDIEYYKKALEYKVFDFILKPTCLEDFQRVFGKLKKELDEERLQQKRLQLLERMARRGDPRQAQGCLGTILQGRFSWPELRGELRARGSALEQEGVYVIGAAFCAGTSADEGGRRQPGFWQQAALEAVESAVQDLPHLAGAYRDREIVCLCNADGEESLRRRLEQAFADFPAQTGGRIFAGISKKSPTLAECGYFYRQAYIAMRQITYLHGQAALAYRDMPGMPQIEKVDFDQAVILNSLFFALDDRWRAEVDTVFAGCAGRVASDYDYIDCICNNLYFAAISRLQSIVQQFAEPENFHAIITEILPLEEKRRFFTQVLQGLQCLAEGERTDNRAKLVKRINRVIDENFANTQLSLSFVSEAVGRSPAYISSLYKQETDRNINDVIVARRIEYAKELLRTTSHKTYRIAEEVGYADCSYFIKVFKKHVGLSPKEYRDSAVKFGDV
ncbi:hypothetical protein B5E65_05555 [Gemmiger sp. An120]|uniref:response regulator n=1 Tax=Gemmiger sp. An120 TaxID=1965549 RepID=UPI000B39DBC0|nr:response regulator [Gemmiger sp. An120]OUQ43238.1 hypothetical protein B5E65_05555 [Gemmiger sp. An120]